MIALTTESLVQVLEIALGNTLYIHIQFVAKVKLMQIFTHFVVFWRPS